MENIHNCCFLTKFYKKRPVLYIRHIHCCVASVTLFIQAIPKFVSYFLKKTSRPMF